MQHNIQSILNSISQSEMVDIQRLNRFFDVINTSGMEDYYKRDCI